MDPKLLDLPLGVKIPLIPGTKPVWSRGKLGEELYRPFPHFTLDDPYLYQIRVSYNCLHDRSLRKYHKRKDILKLLKQQGFVTSDNKVVCTLKEFNEYRQYLTTRKLQAEQALMRQEEWTRPPWTKSKHGPKLPGATNTSRSAGRRLKAKKPYSDLDERRASTVTLGQEYTELPSSVSNDSDSPTMAERTRDAKALEREVLETVEQILEKEGNATTSGSPVDQGSTAKQGIFSAIQRICPCGPGTPSEEDFQVSTDPPSSQGAAQGTLPSTDPQVSKQPNPPAGSKGPA